MLSCQILYYSTPADQIRSLGTVSDALSVKYAPVGRFPTSEIPVYQDHVALPELGLSKHGDHVRHPSYLVMDSEVELQVREETLKDGQVAYDFDLFCNRCAFSLTPGGLYGNTCLINGSMKVHSLCDPSALELFEAFRAHFLAGYRKIGIFHVSPEAQEWLSDGFRLASAATGEHGLLTPAELRT